MSVLQVLTQRRAIRTTRVQRHVTTEKQTLEPPTVDIRMTIPSGDKQRLKEAVATV